MVIYDALSDLQGAMKYVYEEDMSLLDYTDDHFLKALKKETDFEGKFHALGIDYGGGKYGSDPTKVFGQISVRKEAMFLVPPKVGYAVANVSGLAIQVGRGNGSILDVVKLEVDRALAKGKEQLLQGLFGNSGGAKGRLRSDVTLGGYTAILNTPSDIINFRVGDVVQLSATDGTSGSVRSGTLTVSARDAATGTLTFTALISSISGAAASDYIFQNGDFGLGMFGVGTWIPTTAPTSGDAVMGFDRSADPTLLAGLRLTPSATRLDEAIAEFLSFAEREQVHPDYCIMNPDFYADLQKIEGALVRVNMPQGEGRIGFSSMMINTSNGPIPIEVSAYCPKSVGVYFLTMEDWALKTTMKAPSILDQDVMWLRVSGDDAYECRIGWYGNLICSNPHRSGVLIWS